MYLVEEKVNIAFADDFATSFKEFDEFLEFLEEREDNSEWKSVRTANIFVVDAKNDDDFLSLFQIDDIKDVVNDTIRNSGLLILVEDEAIPLRDTGLRGLLERAKISGPALSRVSKEVLAEILQKCLIIAKGKTLIKIQDSKISGMHGNESYKILPMTDIFEIANNYIKETFMEASFKSASYNHSKSTATWVIEDELLIESYAKTLEKINMFFEINPSIRIVTSDVGISGANIYPMLAIGDKNIMLGSSIILNHKGKSSLDVFKENLNMIYSSFIDAVESLEKLEKIKIYNPTNCMGYVMKRLGLSKKYGMDAIELYTLQKGNELGITSALDIFFGMTEILSIMEANKEPIERIINAEEDLSKAISIKWSNYDIAGMLNW